MHLLLSSTLLMSAAVPFARAANDWTKPCLKGECAYDIAGSDTSIAASMRIVSPPHPFLISFFFTANPRARSGARPTRSPT